MQKKNKPIPKFDNPLEQNEYYRSKALNYIGFKMRTRAEVERSLKSHECPESLCEEILEFLVEYRYVEDEAYVKSYIVQSRNLQHWSKRDITGRLLQKGVSSDLIETAFAEMPEDDEAREARILFEKKLRSMETPDAKKLTAYMLRKGFSYDIVRPLVREYADDEWME